MTKGDYLKEQEVLEFLGKRTEVAEYKIGIHCDIYGSKLKRILSTLLSQDKVKVKEIPMSQRIYRFWSLKLPREVRG